MDHKKDRLFSLLIGLIIITYGVLGPTVLPYYQSFVKYLLSDEIFSSLESVFNGSKIGDKDVNNMGKYFVYYPSYLILHLGLIGILFRKTPKSRNIGVAFILVGLPAIAVLSILFHFTELKTLYEISYSLFKTFVGMPFILFIVEGGRILDHNIDRLLKNKD